MGELYNSIDYTVLDIAYIKNSLPKYTIKTKFTKPHKPNTCDDFITTFTNLLELPTTTQLYDFITQVQNITDDFPLNEIANIWFYIRNIAQNIEQQSILTALESNNNIKINFRDIFIDRSIKSFKDNYTHKFNKRNSFRQLDPVISSDHVITSSTKTFMLDPKYTLNDVFNSMKLTGNFPICKYYTYIKLHKSIDNINVLTTNLTDTIYNYKSDNSDQIILFYLLNSSKPELTKSYIPIRLFKHTSQKNVHIHFNISNKSWNLLKDEFRNIFININIGSSTDSFKQGYIFFKNNYYNHALMSHICLLDSDNFVIKNEKSSTNMVKFKMVYNTNIDISMRNKNIIGNEKIPLLKEYPSNTKYIEIFFKNVLHDGDICNIKKYFGKLLTLYSLAKVDLTRLYSAVISDFSEKENISTEKEVKSKDLSQFIMQNLKTLPKPGYTYSRDCQKTKKTNKQPSLTTNPPDLQDYMADDGKFSQFFKVDRNDRLYMKWPKDDDEDVYFYCDDDINKEFNIASINTNQVPCCFKNFQKPKNERYFLTSSTRTVKELTQTIKENLYSNYNITLDTSLKYKTLSTYVNTRVDDSVKNLDYQSTITSPESTTIEYVTISLEYTNNMNILK